MAKPYVPYKGESWEHERTPEDLAYERAWCTAYAIAYKHDPRPALLACAGYNRFEICRDAPELPRMARYFAMCDATIERTKHLPPWDRARALARTECIAFGYPREHIRRMDDQLVAMERAERASGLVRKRAVTSATISKWFHAAAHIGPHY